MVKEKEGPPRVEDLDPEVEKKLFAIIAGVSGQSPVNRLAEQLGISRERYYELQRKFLKAARESLKPQKPGPKKKQTDPEALQKEVKELRKQLKRTESLLAVAKRQTKGPQDEDDPDPLLSGGSPRKKSDKGNRYSASEKKQALKDVGGEKALGATKER